jgi:hypothetical protein
VIESPSRDVRVVIGRMASAERAEAEVRVAVAAVEGSVIVMVAEAEDAVDVVVGTAVRVSSANTDPEDRRTKYLNKYGNYIDDKQLAISIGGLNKLFVHFRAIYLYCVRY